MLELFILRVKADEAKGDEFGDTEKYCSKIEENTSRSLVLQHSYRRGCA
jgi:hypothetical protein